MVCFFHIYISGYDSWLYTFNVLSRVRECCWQCCVLSCYILTDCDHMCLEGIFDVRNIYSEDIAASLHPVVSNIVLLWKIVIVGNRRNNPVWVAILSPSCCKETLWVQNVCWGLVQGEKRTCHCLCPPCDVDSVSIVLFRGQLYRETLWSWNYWRNKLKVSQTQIRDSTQTILA